MKNNKSSKPVQIVNKDKDPIDLKNKGSIKNILAPEALKHQPMQGFEEQYTDIVDYIVRITHRIWEERDMAYIYDTYAHNCTVHTPNGTSYGIEGMIANSVAFLAAIPDRKVYAEDVIWTGDDTEGFISSHLVRSIGTNTGHSQWGPPSFKAIGYFGVANCLVKENRIVEEWLVRDNAALVRQMGFDPVEIAKQSPQPEALEGFGETERIKGQQAPEAFEVVGDDQTLDLVRLFFHDIFNRKRFSTIRETHREDVHMYAPNHRTLYGVGAVNDYFLKFVAMFADSNVWIEQLFKIGTEQDGFRICATWRFSGTHAHSGYLGKASNKRVDTLAISQFHVKDKKIHKHFLVMDELAILEQIYAHGV